MKSKTLKWYKIIGHPVQTEPLGNMEYIYFVESESPHNVLKNHGGMRKCETKDGVRILVQFPTREKNVQLIPTRNLDPLPVSIMSNEVIKIIPVARYECTCGEERYSEHPYVFMCVVVDRRHIVLTVKASCHPV